jgi:hypothetical protein
MRYTFAILLAAAAAFMSVTREIMFAQEAARGEVRQGTAKSDAVRPSNGQTPPERGPDQKAEPIFSGPQAGEKLPPFSVRGVFDADAGKELDFVRRAEAKPIVLVFVHEANRPSIGFTRVLTTYTVSRAKDGLATGVVWLADDVTEAESAVKRMRQALSTAPIGISVDGKEGPGSYGLNRNVTLTIVVAKENKVTANFALVQPSIQVDLPKILEAVVKVAGGTAPKLEDLPGVPAMMTAARNEPDPRLRGLIAPVIQLNASEEAVDRAAAAVEKTVAEDEGLRAQVGRTARTIVESGRLSTYGTPRAQTYLRKWATEYGGLAREAAQPEKDK